MKTRWSEMLPEGAEITTTSNAVTMFIEKPRHVVTSEPKDAEVILLAEVYGAIQSGAGQWIYDTGAGNAETLVVSLQEPYDDVVALIRYDEHKAPSDGFTKCYAIITVMPRARAHRAQQDGRWVSSPNIANDFVSRPADVDQILLTFLVGGRWESALVGPDKVREKVSDLIASGADPLSFVRWQRMPPEERTVDVVVRY